MDNPLFFTMINEWSIISLQVVIASNELDVFLIQQLFVVG